MESDAGERKMTTSTSMMVIIYSVHSVEHEGPADQYQQVQHHKMVQPLRFACGYNYMQGSKLTRKTGFYSYRINSALCTYTAVHVLQYM